MDYATTEIKGFEEEHHQLPFVENVPADCRTEEEEVKGAQDAAEDAKLLYIRMRRAGGVQARFRKSRGKYLYIGSHCCRIWHECISGVLGFGKTVYVYQSKWRNIKQDKYKNKE